MTISAFANEYRPDGWDSHGTPVRRAYRERKRAEAEERQARFDAEVQQVAREQNCHINDARDIARSRRRFAIRAAERRAAA